ncbi:cell division protein SepF [bacterium]|nr:cell division protein SepF [bacterium]
MAIVTEKIKSVLDYLVGGFNPKEENIFEDMVEDDMEGVYEVQDNLAIDPAYSYQPKTEKVQESKVVSHPSFRSGYEVRVMEPRSFDDAAQIVQNLKDRQTIVLNLHLLDKAQAQRTIDFVCGAAHALNGKPQKVGDIFIFTPSNVTLSVDVNANQNKFDDSLWRGPLQ